MHRDRLHYLDFLRGIAALLVILEHAIEHLNFSGFDYFVSNRLSLGQLGVLIFFILSGYIIPYSYENVRGHLGAFWVSRVFRLYPLYIVVIIITLSFEFGFFGVHVKNLTETLLAHTIFIQEWIGFYNFGGPSWTLFLELLWYVGFTVICILPFKRYFGVFYSFIIAAYALVDMISVFVDVHLPLGRLAYIYSFLVGYLCYLYRNERVLSLRQLFLYLLPLISVIYISLVIGFGLHPRTYKGDLYFSLTDVLCNWTLGLFIFGLVFCYPRHTYPSVLLYLGRISYSIYMIHPIVLEVLTHFGVNRWFYLPVVLFVTFGVSNFTYEYIEKPFIKIGKSINNRIVRPA